MKLNTLDKIFAPVRLVKISVLGHMLALEESKILAKFRLDSSNRGVTYKGGAVIGFRGEIIPLIDYRASATRFTSMLGQYVIVLRVLSSHVAIIVDEAPETFTATYLDSDREEYFTNNEHLYLEGHIFYGNGFIRVVNMEKFLAPSFSSSKPTSAQRSDFL